MMCLNCLVGLHNLCLHSEQKVCKCVHWDEVAMQITVRDLKEHKNFKENHSHTRHKAVKIEDKIVLLMLQQIAWYRSRRPDSEVKSRETRQARMPKPKVMCEECNQHPGTRQSKDGFWICGKCDREFSVMHHRTVPVPVIKQTIVSEPDMLDMRPPAPRFTITREDAYARHSDLISLGE